MKKIALLIPGLDRIAGAERQLMLLAQGLARRGWRVSVIALTGAGGDAAATLRSDGVAFLSLRMKKGLSDPRGWIRLRRWLRSENPEIVHAHLPHAAWMARWSRLAAPVRVVIDTIHTTATGTPGRRWGYRWSRWLPDKVTAVSYAVAEAYSAARMATAAQLTVVPNGIDADRWKPDAALRNKLRDELGMQSSFLWLAVGRLEEVKDYPALLHAMAALPPDAQLVIAGSGTLKDELMALSKALALENRVRFLGFEPDLLRWMQAADGLVLSSRWEGLPMAVLEAAACEVPAVVTDVAGTREAVLPGETGWLAQAGDADNLAATMRRLMSRSEAERSAMGACARHFVLRKFSLNAVLDQWEALYAQLLAANPVPKRRA